MNQKKNICFFARSAQARLYANIANLLLEEPEFNAFFVVNNKEEERILKKNYQGKDIVLYNIELFLESNWNNQKLLEAISIDNVEDEYAIPSLWKLFYTDRFFVHYDYEDAIKFIKLHIALSLKIFEEQAPHFFINEAIALFFPYLFFEIGKKKNCQYIGIISSRIEASKYIHILKSPKSLIPRHLDYYENGDLTKSEIDKAKVTIEKIVKSKEKPDYINKWAKIPQLRFSFVIAFVKYIYYQFKPKPSKYNYTLRSPQLRVLQDILFFIRYYRQRKYFRDPGVGDKYILYPLHFTPEASTLVNAPFFEKQLNIIDFIVKSIPGDYKLYVKEHSSVPGHKKTAFYQYIKKHYPSVVLIDLWCDTHEYIKNASAVVVLTSTTGLEALLYKVPIIIFGNVFFEKFKYANKIDAITEDLPYQIKMILNKEIPSQAYFNELEKYIAAYLKSRYPGNYLLGHDQDIVNSPDNVSNLLDAIKSEINR